MPRMPPEFDRHMRELQERAKKAEEQNPIKQLIGVAQRELKAEIKALARAHKKVLMTTPLNTRVWGHRVGEGDTASRLRDALVRKDAKGREDMIRHAWAWTTAQVVQGAMGNLLRVGGSEYYPKTFHQVLAISHQDGTHMTLPNACYAQIGSIVVIWTEHCGYHLFSTEDLDHWRVYAMMPGDTQAPLEVVE